MCVCVCLKANVGSHERVKHCPLWVLCEEERRGNIFFFLFSLGFDNPRRTSAPASDVR